MIDAKTVMARMLSDPEVTKAQAQAAVTGLIDRVEAGEPDAIAILSNIAGMACTIDHTEHLRRAIRLLCAEGPISMEGIIP